MTAVIRREKRRKPAPRWAGVTLSLLALGASPERVQVGEDEATADVLEQLLLEPATDNADGGLHRGAGHVGQALPGQMEGQRDPVLSTRPLALGQSQERG